MSVLTRCMPRSLLGLAALATVACADGGLEPMGQGNSSASSTVSLVNDGTVALQSLRVRTSANDVLVLAKLDPGQSAGPYPVSVMHSNPSAEAAAQGRLVAAIPVEGFDAFNAPRASGAYVIRLRVGSETGYLDVRVSPPLP